MAEYLTSVKVYAWLSGAWVNLSDDVLQTNGMTGSWGIDGYKATDILADTGTLEFTLYNGSGKYYPNGPSALTGWGRFVPIRMELTYLGLTYRFRFYVDKIALSAGTVPQQARANIGCVDWMDFAAKRPILAPNILTSVTANTAMTALVNAMPILPQARDLMTGDNVFQSVYDNIGMKTTAYAEMSKLANSEWGYCYLTKDPANGETLVLENGKHRSGSHPVGQIGNVTIVTTPTNITWEDDDLIAWEDGDEIIWEDDFTYTTTPADILITPTTFPIDGMQLRYGENVVNRFTVEAIPKRVDATPVVLYSLGNPIKILAGETIDTYRARYTDPQGGGRVNAIVSSMLPPEVPGATDPYLKTLLHFTADSTDSTGLHTWTMGTNDMIFNNVYQDGAGKTWSNNIVGPYIVFGGYGNYYLTTPTHADFNFGSGAFTIGWKENRFNPEAGAATMTRNSSSNYPPFLLGKSDGTNMLIYMSSNGTSWDIANGKSLGKVNVGRWTDYEISRDENGWFRAFADGQLTDKWFKKPSTFSMGSGGTFSVGKAKIAGANMLTYMAFDELFIKKGECLHKSDFTPRAIERKTTLEGDYQLNTSDTGDGTDLSADMSLTATYGVEAVTYSAIKNNSAFDGYVTLLQARGRGVYSYNPIEDSAEDTASQLLYGYQALSMRQPYQQSVTAGMTIARNAIIDEKDSHTDLLTISFVGNRCVNNMSLFLQADIGTLVQIQIASIGINSFYYIQRKSFTLSEGGLLRYTFGLREEYNHFPAGVLFDEHFPNGTPAYTWAENDLFVTGAIGTIANPGQVLLTYGPDVGAYYVYASGETAFTWADVDTATITMLFSVSLSMDEVIFIGLQKPGSDAKIGFRITGNLPGLGGVIQYQIEALGCDATIGNEWGVTLGMPIYTGTTSGMMAFTIRRVSATSAAFSYGGGAETIVTDALPADGDTLRPRFTYISGAAANKFISIDRVLVTEQI